MTVNEDHFALVIGVDDYPNYRSLNGAKRDAQDFRDWLIDRETGGGLKDEHVWLVLSDDDPARPIHKHIDDALEKLLDAAATDAARLYIYFSGHGLSRSKTATDLCLAEWSRRRNGLALDSADYLEMLSDSGRFPEIIMLLDCCRIRKVRRRALPPTIDPARPGDNAPEVRTFVAYATEFLNLAHEVAVEADELDPDTLPLVRGHFTQALIQGLRGAAAESTGGVKASRLKEHLEVRTPEIALLSQHHQTPEVVNGLLSNPEPIFGSALPLDVRLTMSVEINFQSADDRHFVLEDGNLDIIKEGTAAGGPWSLDLPRGQYFVREENKSAGVHLRISGHEMETINVTV